MKRILETLEMTVFVHATEDEEKVLKSMRMILPDKFELRKSLLTGHYGNPILKISCRYSGKDVQEWFGDLVRKLEKTDLEKLLGELERKIDKSCCLYLRFDKQEAFNGKLRLCEGDDVVHLRLKVLSRPANPKNAAKILREFLKEIKE